MMKISHLADCAREAFLALDYRQRGPLMPACHCPRVTVPDCECGWVNSWTDSGDRGAAAAHHRIECQF